MASDKASDDIQHNEKLTVPAYAAEVDTHDIDEAKLVRKIDWALIPWSVVAFVRLAVL